MARIVSALAALLALVAPSFARADALSEPEVIRLALARDPESLLAAAQADLAEARAAGEGLYPNPIASWERQRIGGTGPNAQSQDEIALEVPVSLSGRRRARREIARASAALARSDAERARSRAVQRALDAYQAAVAARERVAILRRTAGRLEEAARVLTRRFEEGTTSGYESNRIEIAAELARSELREAEARADIAREELALFLALDPDAFTLPERIDRPSTARTGERAPAAPRSLASAREAAEAADDARRAARRALVPDLSVSGGVFVGSYRETELGYSVGASVEVPLTSRGQELRAEARAQRALADARVASAERTIAVEVRRAARELEVSLEELGRFEAAVVERAELLERSVEAGYREGRRSVLELVDVQRARTEVDARRLELTLSAKRAETALRAARGEFE